jgi:processive 1,2-diacylglycerol beta-glucosyltransferase
MQPQQGSQDNPIFMRVLILTSSTGGGHDMRAEAFRTWAAALPELGLEMRQFAALEESHGIYAFGVWLYNTIQNYAPYMHHVYFNFLEVVPVVRTSKPLGAEKYKALLEEYRPDIILSVHDSLNHGFFEYARTVLGADKVKCVTYCGELFGGYGFSRHWVNKDADLFIGAVPECCDAAISCGIPRERTQVGGFMLRRVFYDEPETPAQREEYFAKELQLDPGKFTVLLSASRQGAQNHLRFLEAMKRRGVSTQVVALCGKNQEAEKQVRDWGVANPSIPTRVLPSNTNVGRLMRSVSAVLARPGTGTTSEAIRSRCPLLLNCLGSAMPQEWITVKFCRKHRIAETVSRPDDLAKFVAAWQSDPSLPAGIRERMVIACPPGHPRDVLQKLINLTTN